MNNAMKQHRYLALQTSQRGVSLVMAVFIIVVLSLLAAALIRILSAGEESVAREVLSTRAFLTAQSGAQLRLSDIFTGGVACTNTCPTTGAQNYGGFGNSNWLNCEASVSCCRVQPAGGDIHYRIVSTGRCGPAGERAARVVEIMARDG